MFHFRLWLPFVFKINLNYFFLQIREIMASLGIRKFQELVGRTDLLTVRDDHSPKASTLNFSMLLKSALELRPNTNIIGGSLKQNFDLEKRIDNELIERCRKLIEGDEKHVTIDMTINNEDRAFTSTLSYEIAR